MRIVVRVIRSSSWLVLNGFQVALSSTKLATCLLDVIARIACPVCGTGEFLVTEIWIDSGEKRTICDDRVAKELSVSKLAMNEAQHRQRHLLMVGVLHHRDAL